MIFQAASAKGKSALKLAECCNHSADCVPVCKKVSLCIGVMWCATVTSPLFVNELLWIRLQISASMNYVCCCVEMTWYWNVDRSSQASDSSAFKLGPVQTEPGWIYSMYYELH